MPRLFAVIAVSLAGALLSPSAPANEGRAIVRLLESLSRSSRLPERELEAILLERVRVKAPEIRSLGEAGRLASEIQTRIAGELAADRVFLGRLGIEGELSGGFAHAREAFLAERPALAMRGARGNPVADELARQALTADAVFLETTGRPLLGQGCEGLADASALRTLRDISEGMSGRAARLGRGASAEALDGALESAAADALGTSGAELWRDRLCRLILVCRVFDSSFGRARCR